MVAKLSASSGSFTWVVRLGSSSTDYAASCATDSSENLYVGGVFAGTTMTVGSTTLTRVGSYDIFIVKVRPTKSGHSTCGFSILVRS